MTRRKRVHSDLLRAKLAGHITSHLNMGLGLVSPQKLTPTHLNNSRFTRIVRNPSVVLKRERKRRILNKLSLLG